MNNEKNCFHLSISGLASLHVSRIAGTDYLNFPHYFNVLNLRGKNGREILDHFPTLQDAGLSWDSFTKKMCQSSW